MGTALITKLERQSPIKSHTAEAIMI